MYALELDWHTSQDTYLPETLKETIYKMIVKIGKNVFQGNIKKRKLIMNKFKKNSTSSLSMKDTAYLNKKKQLALANWLIVIPNWSNVTYAQWTA